MTTPRLNLFTKTALAMMPLSQCRANRDRLFNELALVFPELHSPLLALMESPSHAKYQGILEKLYSSKNTSVSLYGEHIRDVLLAFYDACVFTARKEMKEYQESMKAKGQP